MTVPSEAHYQQLNWTGAETQFAPGFLAEQVSDVTVSYLDAHDDLHTLTRDTHYTVTLGTDGAVSVFPLPGSMPAATAGSPVTLIFERVTPALQGVDFSQLGRYSAVTHQTLHDRAFRILGELRGRLARALAPFLVTDATVDFRPRRVRAADPVDDVDVATKGWVLLEVGLLNLIDYVNAAAASATAAAASLASTLNLYNLTTAARDLAQLWAEQTEDTPVTTGPNKYSSKHWAAKAIAAAAIILPYLTQTDDGLFGDPDTGSQDDGVFT